MAQALIFLAPGYEEVEMLTVVDLLRRSNITIDMVSITDSLEVTSSHNVTVKADICLADADFDSAQMIILPGGIPGTPNLLACTALTDKIKEFAAQKKWLSAICAAPTIYDKLGLYQGKKATCYPTFAEELTDAVYVKQPVVTDDIFITSRGAGTTIEFAAAIVERFAGKEAATAVLQKIIYNDTY
ncbi:MAG: DJ-1 family glyoxalase III [Butyribacter sp.]|nr:DJ-1/PfpI family protein [bacterium]MDY3853978.1 DJ-1 family glyoxalase III [Butyribacter sp.]